MGQFKPMVKMKTTEPSVELKLKKGGAVEKPKKMMVGGPSEGEVNVTSLPARGGSMPARRPAMPPMAARRRAMSVPPTGAPSRGAPIVGAPIMKEGGETKAAHASEMKKMASTEKKLSKHASMPASKAHKGLKTGGVAKSPKPGNYKTGGVVNGQGGFKEGGIIKSTKGETKMVTAKVDTNSAPTGDVKLGNGGGYKKGGSAKKAYATGGSVNDSGHPVAYPKKPASASVKNNLQSGTFKKGGKVKMNEGGKVDLSKGAYDKSIGPSEEEMDMAKTIRDIPGKLFRGAKKMMGMDKKPPAGSVTETEKSVTVTPAKKRGGSVKC